MFFCKDKKKSITAVEAIVSLSGKKYKYATGVSVDPDQWDAKGHRAKYSRKYPEAKDINKKLDELEEVIGKVADEYKWKVPPTPNVFRLRIKERLNQAESEKLRLISYIEDFYKAKKFEKTTRDKYITAINKFKDYEKFSRKKIYLQDIDIDFYNSFREWFYGLISKKGKPYSKNYFGSIVKVLVRVMNYASQSKDFVTDEHHHSDFIVEEETSETIYLTTEELMKIHNLQITPEKVREFFEDISDKNVKQKIKSMEIARAKTMIGGFTALRVSDFNNLARTDFRNNYLMVTTKKTMKPVVVPVNSVVKHYLTTEFFGMKMSEQKINDRIKEVCQIAGINELITVARTHAGKMVKTTLPKYKLVTTHTFRRSAATNMFKAGIPAISIMKLTGHTTEKSFLKYIKISVEENAELLAKHPYFQ